MTIAEMRQFKKTIPRSDLSWATDWNPQLIEPRGAMGMPTDQYLGTLAKTLQAMSTCGARTFYSSRRLNRTTDVESTSFGWS